MCGILGTVNIPLQTAALDLLAHRGPDGEGSISVPVGAHQVSLGHRRLAIVDLSENGQQPMVSSDRRHWLVYNGEIYNHAQLRQTLPDVGFRGHSDTETLLEGLVRRGIGVLNDLNGIFAFAWLNLAERKLYLVRDRCCSGRRVFSLPLRVEGGLKLLVVFHPRGHGRGGLVGDSPEPGRLKRLT